MNFSHAQILIDSTAVTPTLKINVALRHENAELPIVVDGGLYTESDRFLVPLHAEPRKNAYHEYLYPEGADGARHEMTVALSFWAPLSARHLDVIEELREKNRKGDVILKVALSVQYQRLKTELVDLGNVIRHVDPPKPSAKRLRSAAAFLTTESGPRHSGPSVLSTRSHVVEQTSLWQSISSTIPGSDWINDYSPALGRGRFFVVEVPDASGQDLPDELKARFGKAAESVASARKKLLSGEWNDACEDLRAFYELMRTWPEVDDLIKADYGADAATAFSQGIRSFFEFSSKFLHPLARDGRTLNPSESANKEDAQLLYSLSASALNLIAKKWRRVKR